MIVWDYLTILGVRTCIVLYMVLKGAVKDVLVGASYYSMIVETALLIYPSFWALENRDKRLMNRSSNMLLTPGRFIPSYKLGRMANRFKSKVKTNKSSALLGHDLVILFGENF